MLGFYRPYGYSDDEFTAQYVAIKKILDERPHLPHTREQKTNDRRAKKAAKNTRKEGGYRSSPACRR
jgi:hypothetical protein